MFLIPTTVPAGEERTLSTNPIGNLMRNLFGTKQKRRRKRDMLQYNTDKLLAWKLGSDVS